MSSRLLADLEPVTRDMAAWFLDVCKELEIDIIVTCTFRSKEKQDALYAQGRTAPGAIVTKARGGESAHNWGMALDVVPVVNGKPDWNASLDIWETLGSLAAAAGLDWGGNWVGLKDMPHLQRKNWKEFIDAKTQVAA